MQVQINYRHFNVRDFLSKTCVMNFIQNSIKKKSWLDTRKCVFEVITGTTFHRIEEAIQRSPSRLRQFLATPTTSIRTHTVTGPMSIHLIVNPTV